MTTAPAASLVTSLAVPIAIPTVAAAMAGASLIPSPTNTVGALATSASTIASLPSGEISACTSVIPTRSASQRTSLSRSPETSITRDRPWAGRRWSMKVRPSARGVS